MKHSTSTTEITIDVADLANRIRDAHTKCEAAVQEGLARAIEAGKLLIEAKSMIGHGGWIAWLTDNVGIPERTAQAYMRVARRQHELEQKRNGVADLSFREALALLAEPDRTTQLNSVTVAIGAAVTAARPRLDEMKRVLDDPATPVQELARIVNEADEIQNQLAELRLRGARLAGALTAEFSAVKVSAQQISDMLIPPDGKYTFLSDNGIDFAVIVPSDHPGFYHVAQFVNGDFADASIVGTKKPIRADMVKHVIDPRFADATPDHNDPDELVANIPWDFNHLIYNSQQEYFNHAVLGKVVER